MTRNPGPSWLCLSITSTDTADQTHLSELPFLRVNNGLDSVIANGLSGAPRALWKRTPKTATPCPLPAQCWSLPSPSPPARPSATTKHQPPEPSGWAVRSAVGPPAQRSSHQADCGLTSSFIYTKSHARAYMHTHNFF